MSTENYYLTLTCPNKPGIVAAVSTYIFELGGDIEEAQQFDDKASKRFFMRVSFSCPANVDSLRAGFVEIAKRFELSWELRAVKDLKRILIMASKLDHCLVDLLYRWRIGELPMIICGLGILFSGAFNGIGILCAGLILAMMILPFIASVMRDVFEIVPPVLKESAYGIGCTTWEVVKNVVLPYTKAGVIGGIMLGLGRALGETMAVTFVIGNAHRLSASLFSPGTSIASTLANEFGEAEAGNHLSSLYALGLALFIITFVVLACAKWMLISMEKRQGLKT